MLELRLITSLPDFPTWVEFYSTLSMGSFIIRLNKDCDVEQCFSNVTGFTSRGLESCPVGSGKMQLQGHTDGMTTVTSERIELTYVELIYKLHHT